MNSTFAIHLTTDLLNPTDDDLDDLVDFLAPYSGVPARVDGRLELQITVTAEHLIAAVAQATDVLTDAAKHVHRTGATIVGIEVLTDDEFTRRIDGPPRAGDLVSTSEVATLLMVSRQRVLALAKRADFPASTQLGSRGLHWSRTAVERWAATWDRRPGPKATPENDEAVTPPC